MYCSVQAKGNSWVKIQRHTDLEVLFTPFQNKPRTSSVLSVSAHQGVYSEIMPHLTLAVFHTYENKFNNKILKYKHRERK